MDQVDRAEPQTEPSPRKFSRRRVLKGIGAGIAASALSFIPDSRNNQKAIIRKRSSYSREGSNIDDIDSKRVPDKLPEDVLSDEELKKKHITINNSQSTKLYLRKEALNFPIFRDSGKIGFDGVVITLVDSPTVSWNSADTMPEDAKKIFREEYDPEDDRKQIRETIKRYDRKLDDLDKEKTRAVEASHWREVYEEIIKDYQNNLDNVLETGGPLGIIMDKRRWFQGGKIYIFLAVGGHQKPNPKHSYLDPYGGYPPDDKYAFVLPAGYVIRHELSHYGHPDESEADILAANSLVDALEKYKKTGDSSGYAFVFVNDRGITITRKKDQAVGV